MEDARSLREAASRARQFAAESTDKKAQADLLVYARELDERAVRMEAAMGSRSAVSPRKDTHGD